ncbi:hypothetical protein AYO44_18335 [Planctomycetaceae bacterium SCGC AG-212-F19]|nr:hypothetical protein AYO44_18335 [Planctomycetaceae bacterium SCGC AG-212-F19]
MPGAIDIVDAPTAGPGADLFLGTAYEFNRPVDHRFADTMAVMAQRLEHTRGDVRAAGVEHRVVIGERHLRQHFAVDIAIERRPAAVGVLHGA